MDDLISGLLEVIVKGLVTDTDSVRIEKELPATDGMVLYRITVGENDMGRVIGKKGRIVKSIRNIVQSAAIKNHVKVAIEIG